MARVVPLVGRLAITCGLLVLLVVVAEPRRVLTEIADVRALPFAATIVLTAGDRVLMALKWLLLLTTRGIHVSAWLAIRAYFSASFVGLFLPVTIGADAMRVLALRAHGAAEIAASIVVERVLGLVAVASVAVAGCLLLALATNEPLGSMVPIVLGLAVTAGAALGLSLPIAARLASRARGVPPLVGKIATAYARYRDHPPALVAFYGLSVVESLVPAFINYTSALAIGVTVPLEVFVITVPLALAVARLPISLGGFGVQEASFVYLAGLLGVPTNEALSIMLVSDAALLLALLPAAVDSAMLDLRRKTSADPVL